MFGSEDCQLTERVWASTERQKLEEFSTKVSMTATSTIVTATINAGSRVKPTNEPLPSAFSPAKTAAEAGIEGEAGKGSTKRHGVSSLPSRATAAAATTNDTGTKHSAPYHSSTFGRDGGGGSSVPPPESPRDDAVIRGRFDDKGYHPAAAAAAAGAAFKNASTSRSTGSEEDTGSEVEVEVEAVGCGVSVSSPYDPEITHPQRVTE